MILTFPNSETLRLALTSGAIPPAVSRTSAVAGVDSEGRLCVEPSVSLARASLADLRRLGVDTARTCEPAPAEHVFCWPQLLPLQRGEPSTSRPEQTPVLFDLPVEQLGSVTTEMLRLGNDRQSFRVLEGAEESEERVLLRVVGPPFYTLLRALEGAHGNGMTAYVECAPRVWVQYGYRHPLGEHFKPSAGKLLIMRPPRLWSFLDDRAFRDIYEVLDFRLPNVPSDWREGQLSSRLRVPLRLAHAGGNEAAELWVVRDDPVSQLDELVQGADDQLLARLAFAVGRSGDRTILVLRARPSRLPPPVLVLNAVAYRSYLRLPNLFLPCGTRLQPPLRRDAVRKRLAEDPGVITWLHPRGDGAFSPESLPDTSFRSLADWVDYVLEEERRPLEAWVQSTLFDFESFVCPEDVPSKAKRTPAPERERSGGAKRTAASKLIKPRRPGPDTTPDETLADLDEPGFSGSSHEPTEGRHRLDALEARFLAVEGPLDAPERQALWPKLADLNTALGQDDASVCWLHALWTPGAASPKWAARWLRAEVKLARTRGAALGREPPQLSPGPNGAVHSTDLDQILGQSDPTTAEVRILAAYLLSIMQQQPRPVLSGDRQNAVGHFLGRHDRLLPVRAAWLAWSSLAAIAGGDVLALARARDRLLERLYHQGLRAEQEMPSFLRFGGQPISHRFRTIRPWLLEVRELAGTCCERMDKGRLIPIDRSRTPACLDLIFAFGMARLGELDEATRLEERATQQLSSGETFHQFLLRAYRFRIRQVRDGKPASGPLPDELLAYIETKDPSDRLPYDRLRQTSRIVEPHAGVRWDQDYLAATDPLAMELAQLPRIVGHKPLAARCRQLLADHRAPPARGRVLEAALEQAPRLGEESAVSLLRQALATYEALPPTGNAQGLTARGELLYRSLIVAAHFDQTGLVQEFIARFQDLLGVPEDADARYGLTALAGQCLRGLRRLGMRTEIEMLLRRMEELLLEGRPLSDLVMTDAPQGGEKLLALLHLAAGWYYFGRDQDAERIVTLARGVLLSGALPRGGHPKARADLACTYAATLGYAPLEFAQKGIVELFQKLESVATSWHTTPGYCALQVKLAEAVVLAVVSDDFTQGTQVRRWLDEDEYLVRKRIHEDLRAMMARAEA